MKRNSKIVKAAGTRVWSVSVFMLILFLRSLSISASPALDSAANAYSKGNYAGAASIYNRFIASGYVSPDVYYNLGNCYYRTNEIAKAILNYERAAKLSPDDADVRFNLQLANQKTLDKITDESPMLALMWINKLVNLASERGWGMMCILFFCLALVLVLLYLFSGRLLLRQVGFWCAILMLLLCVASFALAADQYNISSAHDTVIVMSSTVTVKGSPIESGTSLFVIHEGAKATVLMTLGEWVEIKLANGNQGWLLKSDIERI